ncbi:MAG TPA: putative RNA uridine N3 methyltransferase [Nitrososphaeraceae archaeon]|nr:putative RNA uridine N3 methyltransferase [Nitrososphaeraceae archaeon]
MEAHFPSLSVAIPNTSLIDSKSLLDKSLRVAQFARALSIFRVEKVYIYNDMSATARPDDFKLITLLLEYLDTPQYLRKLLYPKMKLLQFTGMLPPVQSPHHKTFMRASEVRGAESRVGVLLRNMGSWVVDVGLDRTIPFVGQNETSRKANFKLSVRRGRLIAEEIYGKVGDSEYWGYQVISIHTLSEIQKRLHDVKFLITSKRGMPISVIMPSIRNKFKDTSEVILTFGSPRNDIWKMVCDTDRSLVNSSVAVNMFPFQGTRSVRLEEALLGSLAILNSIRGLR